MCCCRAVQHTLLLGGFQEPLEQHQSIGARSICTDSASTGSPSLGLIFGQKFPTPVSNTRQGSVFDSTVESHAESIPTQRQETNPRLAGIIREVASNDTGFGHSGTR